MFGFENWYLRKCQEFVYSKKRKQHQVDSSVLVVAFNMLDDDEFDLESEPKKRLCTMILKELLFMSYVI